MTMAEGEGCVGGEGRVGDLDLEGGGQQQEVHHTNPTDFIRPKDGRSVKREEGGWQESLNGTARGVRVTGARLAFAFGRDGQSSTRSSSSTV